MKPLLCLLFISQIVFSQPWNTWQDNKNLARLNSESQSLLRSSYCPYNCRFDRTSSGDTRFLRIENKEAVIFEDLNPGVITRIWMTTGLQGSSVFLDENITIKFYFNGEVLPTIAMPLPDLFNGSTAPFSYPLVANRLLSSGGNYSYVPINYATSIKITLTNAVDYTLWYQFNHTRFSHDANIDTFDITDDLSPLSNILNLAGDVWQSAQISYVDTINLVTNVEQEIVSSKDAGWIKSILLSVDEIYYQDIYLILKFDGEIRSQQKLSNFFAIGQNNGVKTQSLYLGLNNNNHLYSNFPMPYHENMTISLKLENPAIQSINLSYEVGIDNQAPSQDVGTFATQTINTCPSTPLIDSPMLQLNQQSGKWVGLFSEFSSVGTLSRDYLEGDERIYIDGDTHPTHYGTGTEDFYNGGFYFDQGDFSLPLHGSPYFFNATANQSITSAYRFMLTDGIEFQSSIVAQLENGPFGNLSMCVSSVAYYYTKPNSSYQLLGEINLNSPASIAKHNYQTSEKEVCSVLTANFLDEPATTLTSNLCQLNSGSISFTINNNFIAKSLRLRRLYDNNTENQVADIYVNGVLQGAFTYVAEKSKAYIPSTPDRRWQQESIELGSKNVAPFEITVVPRFISGNFNAAKYQLFGKKLSDDIFTNSFE
ncbi:MAG: DUF2961 domain-containing protein [Proteobacteria bacterium]|nr:DUF2961 domain-containing protein [Pseudomonadota bacterium]